MPQVIKLKITRAYTPSNFTAGFMKEMKSEDTTYSYSNTSTVFTLIDNSFVTRRIDIFDSVMIEGIDYVEQNNMPFGLDPYAIVNSPSTLREFLLNNTVSAKEDINGTTLSLYVNDNHIGDGWLVNEEDVTQLLMHPDVREIGNCIAAARALHQAQYTVLINFSNHSNERDFTIVKGTTNVPESVLFKVKNYNQNSFYTKGTIKNFFKMVSANDTDLVVFAVKVDDKPTEPLMCKVEEIDTRLSDIADLIHGYKLKGR